MAQATGEGRVLQKARLINEALVDSHAGRPQPLSQAHPSRILVGQIGGVDCGPGQVDGVVPGQGTADKRLRVLHDCSALRVGQVGDAQVQVHAQHAARGISQAEAGKLPDQLRGGPLA